MAGSDSNSGDGFYFDVNGGIGIPTIKQLRDIEGHCNTDRNKI